jgi:Bacterial membrane protein YfhO
VLLPGRAPGDFDAFTYMYPYHRVVADAWHHGRWFPLWNPSIYLGVPLLANIQAGALYPPNLLFLLVPGPNAMGWSMVLALAIGGLGMFAYARKDGLGYWGALAGACAFELSSHLTAHAAQVNQIDTFGWAPWLMLAFDRTAARPRYRLIPAIGVLVALVILAGHTQEAYLTLGLAGLAGLLRLRTAAFARRWRLLVMAIATWAAGTLLGALIAAAQLLPTMELQRYSYRQGGLTVAEAGGGALPLSGILGNLLPHYSGQVSAEYAGICTPAAILALGALALVTRWRKPQVVFWAVVSLLAVWASTGTSGKLFTVLFHVVPGLDLFRVPSRLLLFSTVGAALLAGYGLRTAQQLALAARRRGWWAPSLRAVGLVTLLMVVLCAAGAFGITPEPLPRLLRWLPQQVVITDVLLLAASAALTVVILTAGLRLGARATGAMGLALVLLVAGESTLATARYNNRQSVPASLYSAQGTVARLAEPSPDRRYLSLATVPNLGDLPRLIDVRRPNVGMGDGRLTADGYDGGLLPLAEFVRFRGPLLKAGDPNEPDLSLLHMTQTVWDPEWLRRSGVSEILLDRGLDPNPPGCPRCLVAVASSGDITLWRLATGVQPTRAWIEAGGAHLQAHVVEDGGDRLVVTTPDAAGGRLVLADTFYPGWTASLDGRAVSIDRAYGMLRAVSIPPGRHRIVFSYQPRSFQLGALISLLALLVTALLWVLPGGALGRRRRPLHRLPTRPAS